MIQFFNTVDERILPTEDLEIGGWARVTAPDTDDLKFLSSELEVPSVFLKSALDEEETSHLDSEDDMTLIIIDMPMTERNGTEISYYTTPVSIIIMPTCIITITSCESTLLSRLADGAVKGVRTDRRTRFVFQLLLSVSARFLNDLKQIDKRSNALEQVLRKSMRNKELISLLDLQKSLVYFQTSLKSNEMTLQKIATNRYIKLYEEDKDLLEDVIIEIKQAIEMAGIYSSILANTLESSASIISNNLNIVMKILTSLTILMAIPTMIFSFYGMNLGSAAGGLPLAETVWIPVLSSLLITGSAAVLLKRHGML